ncbi:MAG: hypothetical protein MI921_18095 [Cytophagales bacterium]|nr:hypothetical protein [Cytophagales bacterium]
MTPTSNHTKEHLLIPLLIITGLPLLIGLFYLCHEYLMVYTNSETLEFYAFNDTDSRKKYLNSTMTGMVTCFVLFTLSVLSVRFKKSWLLLLLSLLNFSQLTYLLLYH